MGLDLIRSIFSPVDVTRIVRIPLQTEVVKDSVAWQYTRSGTFSVRLADHAEFNHEFGRQMDRSDGQGSVHINPIWKELWQLRILGKVKHFGWKVLKGVLLCLLGILAGRHIPVLPQCPICKVGFDDIQHLLFNFSRAKEVWTKLGLHDVVQRALV